MLGSDIEYPLWSNALSAKSVLGGRVALTVGFLTSAVLVSPGTLKTYTPNGVIGIVEPWTLRLTSRTHNVVTGFLLSATNTTVRATLPPSTLFADRALLHRGYSISEPNA